MAGAGADCIYILYYFYFVQVFDFDLFLGGRLKYSTIALFELVLSNMTFIGCFH